MPVATIHTIAREARTWIELCIICCLKPSRHHMQLYHECRHRPWHHHPCMRAQCLYYQACHHVWGVICLSNVCGVVPSSKDAVAHDTSFLHRSTGHGSHGRRPSDHPTTFVPKHCHCQCVLRLFAAMAAWCLQDLLLATGTRS